MQSTWRKCSPQVGRLYFVDLATGTRVWVLPPGVNADDVAQYCSTDEVHRRLVQVPDRSGPKAGFLAPALCRGHGPSLSPLDLWNRLPLICDHAEAWGVTPPGASGATSASSSGSPGATLLLGASRARAGRGADAAQVYWTHVSSGEQLWEAPEAWDSSLLDVLDVCDWAGDRIRGARAREGGEEGEGEGQELPFLGRLLHRIGLSPLSSDLADILDALDLSLPMGPPAGPAGPADCVPVLPLHRALFALCAAMRVFSWAGSWASAAELHDAVICEVCVRVATSVPGRLPQATVALAVDALTGLLAYARQAQGTAAPAPPSPLLHAVLPHTLTLLIRACGGLKESLYGRQRVRRRVGVEGDSGEGLPSPMASPTGPIRSIRNVLPGLVDSMLGNAWLGCVGELACASQHAPIQRQPPPMAQCTACQLARVLVSIAHDSPRPCILQQAALTTLAAMHAAAVAGTGTGTGTAWMCTCCTGEDATGSPPLHVLLLAPFCVSTCLVTLLNNAGGGEQTTHDNPWPSFPITSMTVEDDEEWGTAMLGIGADLLFCSESSGSERVGLPVVPPPPHLGLPALLQLACDGLSHGAVGLYRSDAEAARQVAEREQAERKGVDSAQVDDTSQLWTALLSLLAQPARANPLAESVNAEVALFAHEPTNSEECEGTAEVHVEKLLAYGSNKDVQKDVDI